MRVQISLDEDDYEALKKLAEEEDRTVAGQARHLLRKMLATRRMLEEGELQMPQNVPVTSLTPRQAELAKSFVDNPPPPGGLSMDDITQNALPSLREDE